MTRTWWVARNADPNNNYVLTEREPHDIFKGSTLRAVIWETKKGFRRETNADFWHRVSTFRLNPGDGPVKVMLELRVRRVR